MYRRPPGSTRTDTLFPYTTLFRSVQDGQVLSVRPDRDNVFSRGHMCPKGTTMGALHHDPDRLRGPVIKKNGTWHEVGWEEALRHCERIAHPDRRRVV